MNRRKFLRSISGFFVAIPFLVKDYKPVDQGEVIEQTKDHTGLLLFNNVSQSEFETAKESYIEKYEFTVIPNINHFNCKCCLEWIEIE